MRLIRSVSIEELRAQSSPLLVWEREMVGALFYFYENEEWKFRSQLWSKCVELFIGVSTGRYFSGF